MEGSTNGGISQKMKELTLEEGLIEGRGLLLIGRHGFVLFGLAKVWKYQNYFNEARE